jgi:hypothetical protein
VVNLIIRRFFLLAFAGAGAWLALHGIGLLAQQVGRGEEFHLSREGIPLLIPVGLAGALLGAFIGGMIIPARR